MRLTAALLTYVGWTLVTLFGLRWASDGTPRPLIETVSHGISWNLAMAVALLAVVTVAMRWRDLGFVAPRPRWLRLLWFPALYLVLFALTPAALGLPPTRLLVFIAINTVLVGLSEEWMFRGVLFRGLRTRLSTWPALLISSVLFGGVHVLNVFVTGQLFDSGIQAVAATLSGVVFMALLLRTGSIWVPIAYHALWDFGTFVTAAAQGAQAATPDLAKGGLWAVPVLLVLPNVLYALVLLRKVPNDPPESVDLLIRI